MALGSPIQSRLGWFGVIVLGFLQFFVWMLFWALPVGLYGLIRDAVLFLFNHDR